MKSDFKIALRTLAIAFACFSWQDAAPFEFKTHATIAYEAYKRSDISQPEMWKILGIYDDVLSPAGIDLVGIPFSKLYFDIKGIAARPRQSFSFEEFRMVGGDVRRQIPSGVRFKIEGLLMAGAIREDDIPSGIPIPNPIPINPVPDPFPDPTSEIPPQDDPEGWTYRLFNHWVDPRSRKPLGWDSAAITAGLTTVNNGLAPSVSAGWSSGAENAFEQLLRRARNTRNHFTMFTAQEALWRAVTLKGTDGESNVDIELAGGSDAVARDLMRKRYWVTVFRTLGHVVHTLQDAAQPQHTRNEQHSGKGPRTIQPLVTGHLSAVESYLEARARSNDTLTPDDVTIVNSISLSTGAYPGILVSKVEIRHKPLETTGYPVKPAFATFADYFVDSNADANKGGGKGMADYSNRGFFTPAKNFGTTAYPSPSSSFSDYTQVLVPATKWDGSLIEGGGKITVYKGLVQDTLAPGQDEPQAVKTSYGLWDEALVLRGLVPRYTLNHLNYDDQAKLLIPRAVAYSAGFLDYFFRGRIEITLPDEGVYGLIDHSTINSAGQGFKTIKLKARNVTPAKWGAQEMLNGRAVLVAKFYRNNCYRSDLSGQWNGSNNPPATCRSAVPETISSSVVTPVSLYKGTFTPFFFTFSPAIPIEAVDLSLQFVYRGPMGGEEDVVVVATEEIPEPTFFSFFNLQAPPGGTVEDATASIRFPHSIKDELGNLVQFQKEAAAISLPFYRTTSRYSRVAFLPKIFPENEGLYYIFVDGIRLSPTYQKELHAPSSYRIDSTVQPPAPFLFPAVQEFKGVPTADRLFGLQDLSAPDADPVPLPLLRNAFPQ